MGQLRELRFWREDGANHLELTLVKDAPDSVVRLRFIEVRSLATGNLDVNHYLQLSVRPIAHHQLETIFLKVTEEENNVISFVCRSYEVQSV